MQPYYEQSGITIYCGDYQDVLPGLGAVPLILTDPPYGKRYHDGGPGKWAPTLWRGQAVLGDASVSAETTMPLLAQRLCAGGALYLFSQWMVEDAWRSAVRDAGLQIRNRLIWVKPHWGAGDLQTTWGPQHEAIIFASKGRHVLHRPRRGDVIREHGSCVRSGKEHPTQKPVIILRPLIGASSQPGDMVLDPFMGSGSTLVAAQLEGRRAIGIEIEEKYCEIAANRLGQQMLPLEMAV